MLMLMPSRTPNPYAELPGQLPRPPRVIDGYLDSYAGRTYTVAKGLYQYFLDKNAGYDALARTVGAVAYGFCADEYISETGIP